MFRSITLTDYQSHHNSHLELGPFTVIVGSSSSGKSAVVRAIRLIAENARGTSYVRQGAKSCRIALEIAGSEPVLDASTVVTVERGKSVSLYEVRLPGMHSEPVVYTKCASNVPDGVITALGLGETRLWVAGQFDRPYLLDETGAEVARVLGRLTNVTMVYAAVRETNRRALEARRSCSVVERELEEVSENVKRFLTLPIRLVAGRAAEEALTRVEALETRCQQLASRMMELEEARARVSAARASVRVVPDVRRLMILDSGRTRLATRLAAVDEAVHRRLASEAGKRSVPDLGDLSSLLSQRTKLQGALADLKRVGLKLSQVSSHLEEVSGLACVAKQKFIRALRDAGKCPLCGADSDHAHVDSVL